MRFFSMAGVIAWLVVPTVARSQSPDSAVTDSPAEDRSTPGIQAQLTLDTLDFWRGRLLPTEQEAAWTEIPWRDALWKAVVEAERDPKPILLWAMNGHPLGCT